MNDNTIFLAGASGAIGMRLVPLLVEAGYSVVGTTRSPEKAARLAALGAEPVVVDVFDAPALQRALGTARPRIVIHQLTDLALLAGDRATALQRNARIRIEGTRNLVEAAIAAGVEKLIAQSIAWVYAPGPEPHSEEDALQAPAEGPAGATMRGVIALEQQTLGSPPLVGIVLRYGRLYGPGTGNDAPAGSPGVHVDAAAAAALLAAPSSAHGIFNIAEPSEHLATERARRELGWDASFRPRVNCPAA
ncbi:MAG: NAD-dependent epimerase/dehydratase family protein [Chloroflexi bacterium]|nr:NAD-dependent epimerase/dehydratase family protein [Chloroflexota bacterium]MBV9599002.1 NAD-dependent epimerase/dehydratase family protein [Chloroflexota bacterium]